MIFKKLSRLKTLNPLISAPLSQILTSGGKLKMDKSESFLIFQKHQETVKVKAV